MTIKVEDEVIEVDLGVIFLTALMDCLEWMGIATECKYYSHHRAQEIRSFAPSGTRPIENERRRSMRILTNLVAVFAFAQTAVASHESETIPCEYRLFLANSAFQAISKGETEEDVRERIETLTGMPEIPSQWCAREHPESQNGAYGFPATIAESLERGTR